MLHNVMRFNHEQTRTRQAWIAEAVGARQPDMDDEAAAAAAPEAVLTLVRDKLALPWRLRDVGVEKNDFAGIATDAMQDLIVATNPRPVASRDEVVELLRQAW